MTSSKPEKRVALAVRAGVPYIEEMFDAIFKFARRANWRLTTALDYWPPLSARNLRGWKGHGVIAFINTPAEAAAVKSLKIPAINLSTAMRHSPVPRVMMDNYAVGRMAAEHLLELGFRRLAYYGVRGAWFSELREAGFVDTVRTAGGTCSTLNGQVEKAAYLSFAKHDTEIRKWLSAIQPPVGVLAVHDYRARRLIEVCAEVGLRVPDDVAIVGVNNDRIVCELSEPQLTSVSPNGRVIGLAAAKMLDQWMHSKRPTAEQTLFAPDGIVRRGSTEVTAVDDPIARRAIQYLQHHFCEEIDITTTAQALDISRRSLERAFLRAMNTSPHNFLARLRVQYAMKLLDQRELTLDAVAQKAGFGSARRLAIVFHRVTGNSPRKYRYHHKTTRGPQGAASS